MTSYTICVFTENSIGLLNKITIIFTRRRINIESLTVAETDHANNLSRITVICSGTLLVIEQIKKSHSSRVIMMSAMSNLKEEAFRRGVDYFMDKPISFVEIRRILGGEDAASKSADE